MEQDTLRWGNVVSLKNVWIHHRKDDHLLKAVNMGFQTSNVAKSNFSI